MNSCVPLQRFGVHPMFVLMLMRILMCITPQYLQSRRAS